MGKIIHRFTRKKLAGLLTIVMVWLLTCGFYYTLPDGTYFDADFYRTTYTELSGTDTELMNQYWFYGIQEGKLPYAGANDVSAASVLNYINLYRTENGLTELSLDTDLQEKAQARARELADNHYFAHYRPSDGSKWNTIYGIWQNTYIRLGENLARGQTSSFQVVERWKTSTGHNAIMLHTGVDIAGVGVAKDINGHFYFVLHVGLRK